jgi:hypothetical protein
MRFADALSAKRKARIAGLCFWQTAGMQNPRRGFVRHGRGTAVTDAKRAQRAASR